MASSNCNLHVKKPPPNSAGTTSAVRINAIALSDIRELKSREEHENNALGAMAKRSKPYWPCASILVMVQASGLVQVLGLVQAPLP
jgi:hypothetical protein